MILSTVLSTTELSRNLSPNSVSLSDRVGRYLVDRVYSTTFWRLHRDPPLITLVAGTRIQSRQLYNFRFYLESRSDTHRPLSNRPMTPAQTPIRHSRLQPSQTNQTPHNHNTANRPPTFLHHKLFTTFFHFIYFCIRIKSSTSFHIAFLHLTSRFGLVRSEKPLWPQPPTRVAPEIT